jgi:biopolymer transport protein ExbB
METVGGFGDRLLDVYRAGGWVMHAITACSIVALAVVVLKLLDLRRLATRAGELVLEVRSRALEGDLAGAIELCDRRAVPVATVIKAGLVEYGQPHAEIERTMERVAAQEMERLERYLPVLGVVATAAPLLGFLGTVVGLIVSFGAFADQGMDQPRLVAAGVATALITTAWGLIVALIAQPFHVYYAARLAAYARELEAAGDLLLRTVAEMEHLGTARATTSHL